MEPLDRVRHASGHISVREGNSDACEIQLDSMIQCCGTKSHLTRPYRAQARPHLEAQCIHPRGAGVICTSLRVHVCQVVVLLQHLHSVTDRQPQRRCRCASRAAGWHAHHVHAEVRLLVSKDGRQARKGATRSHATVPLNGRTQCEGLRELLRIAGAW